MIKTILSKVGLGVAAGCIAGMATLSVGCDDDEPTKPGADAAAGITGMAGTPGAAGAGGATGGTPGAAGVDGGTTTPTDGGPTDGPLTGGTVVQVTADITADTVWTAGNTYVLPANKKLFVRAPAKLTVQAGVVVQGETKSALMIQRGAKLDAIGTPTTPVVFTSAKPVGSRAPGNWGGIVIFGKAPINTGAADGKAEAQFEASADPAAVYGGADPADASGTLKYVRIEFAGEEYLPDREFNGLTLCGVGKGTVIDYVQIHKGSDDGIEFFGGTVDVKHLVITQNQDDGFDTDNGWQGRAQFVVIQSMDPKGTDASNGYESDNHSTPASWRQIPRTLPTVYNVTLVGKKDYANSWGMVFRRGTGGKYYNHIIMDFKRGLVEVRDVETKEQLDAGNLFVKNSIWFQSDATNPAFPVPQTAGDIDEMTAFTATAWANRPAVNPMLTDPYSLTAPNFAPAATSPALTGGATPEASADNFFDATATFVGAVGAANWPAGWTQFPQN